MFKHLTIYALPSAAQLMNAGLGEQLAAVPFQPCGPTEPTTWGFVPPTLKDGADLVEALGGGRFVLAVRRQQRKVPGETVRKRVEELSAAVEQETGRKPGAKRRRELKEQALRDLMPSAFTTDKTAIVLIDTQGDRLAINTTSAGMLDGVLSVLCKAVPTFMAMPWQTAESPCSWMSKVLSDEGDEGSGAFGVGRSLELRSTDARERRVVWKNSNLQAEDVQKNLAAGARVVRMALDFKDRTSFEMLESGQLKGIELDLEGFEQAGDQESEVDAWRGDAELWTAEMVLVINELEGLMGGRCQQSTEGVTTETSAGSDGPDPLYDQAVTVVLTENRAGISMVQNRFKIGYNRAARLLERMEAEGLVSPMKTDGSREVMRAAA